MTVVDFLNLVSLFVFSFIDFIEYQIKKMRHKFDNTIEENVNGKVVVITGGSRGMGKSSAKEFAKRGAIVVIGDINVAEGQETVQEIQSETGNQNVEILHLDMSDMDSVEEFARKVSVEYPKIKILLNNAGIAPMPSNINRRTKDGKFSMLVAVNYLGHFLLTNLLVPNLAREDKSRIVSVSSSLQMLSHLDLDDLMMEKCNLKGGNMLPYCNNKYCLALFTKELSKLVSEKGIGTYALCPTTVATQILGKVTTAEAFIWQILMKVTGISPDEAASEFILPCALDKSLEKETGKMYRFRKQFQSANKRLDDNIARELWRISAELVQLHQREIKINNQYLKPL